MSALDAMIDALRTSVAVTAMTHVHALRISGPGALDLLDAATTTRLFARENQLLHTLLLDEQAGVFADALVGLDEDSWILLAEGPSQQALLAHLESIRRARLPEREVSISDLLTSHALWSLDGPFAWEVTAALLGPEVLGAPYLTFLKLGEVTCFRVGKTGEYGYTLLVPHAIAAQTRKRLDEVGAPFGLLDANLAALDQCALENWHFTIRALEGRPPLSPAELQLQWRVDAEKEFVGAAELRRQLAAGISRRLTCFSASMVVTPGQRVMFGDEEIGAVLEVGWSSVRGDWVGWAVLDVAFAWPGVHRFHVAGADGPVKIETRSPPLLDNRSLFVDPRKHTFQTRHEHVFPPLVPAR